MIKKIPIFLSLLLTGCYLANGSPDSSNYWIKDGKKVSYSLFKECENNTERNMSKRYFYLLNKFRNDYSNLRKNKIEYNEFWELEWKKQHLIDKCLYNLGYRFKAPLYWCLAQDGDNTRVCMENMKYRN